ncbi:hypothetical protein HanRHA438_Chr02g0086511 [Helianthus annuus]|nr:hypothetical protein HanRHA438_Chr02g0086511 [Helianthus annuus]
MDHENNAPSLLKLIEDYDPIFFELFVDQKQLNVIVVFFFLSLCRFDFILSVRYFFSKINNICSECFMVCFSHGKPSIFCDNWTRIVRRPKTVMDHENNAPSLLKLIEDYDPIFFELFVDQIQLWIMKTTLLRY